MDIEKFTEFQTQYPELAGFLGCFVEIGYDKKLTEEQVAKSVLADYGTEYASEVIAQGNQVLSLGDFPMYEITLFSNLYFKNDRVCREWLSRMLDILGTNTVKRPSLP